MSKSGISSTSRRRGFASVRYFGGAAPNLSIAEMMRRGLPTGATMPVWNDAKAKVLSHWLNITNSGATGELDFGAGIATNQLWFTRTTNGAPSSTGSDLQIDLMGMNSHVTVVGWYAQPFAQLSDITTADGSKLDSQISQLVQAMATFANSNPGFDPVTAVQAPNDATLQSALAVAWHH